MAVWRRRSPTCCAASASPSTRRTSTPATSSWSINAEKVAVTGNKRADKRYYRHSGYPGGLRSRTFEEMLARRPEEIIRLAVKGMMPRNRLARKQITKLKIYAGPEHPHVAQKPEPMEIEA